MRTRLSESLLQTSEGQQADAILRRCVHCGFCNSVCPTYRQLGSEMDGPRGRIYQMKRFLEGEESSADNLLHLDRCLTCQACESACPSGVNYLHLLDIVRPRLAEKIQRSRWQRWRRRLACSVLLRQWLLRLLLSVARFISPLLPSSWRLMIPPQPLPSMSVPPPSTKPRRSVVIPDGCVQAVVAADINRHTQAVLHCVGVAVDEVPGFCCGALPLHLEFKEQAMQRIRQNVVRLSGMLDKGAEAIITTASGCGRSIADYGRLLADEAEYAEPARRVSAAHQDIATFLQKEDLSQLTVDESQALSFHCPCTLYHAQQQADTVAQIFARLGRPLPVVAGAGVCCGSAGFYSQEHPQMANQLRDNVLQAHHQAEKIITANIGCQLHLQAGSSLPVRHWIQSLRRRTGDRQI